MKFIIAELVIAAVNIAAVVYAWPNPVPAVVCGLAAGWALGLAVAMRDMRKYRLVPSNT